MNLSLLTNPQAIVEWQKRYPQDISFLLLEHYVDGKLVGMKARQEIYESFVQSGRLFFEGIATKEGFGCKRDVTTGVALIRVAALARKCPEGLNYLGLCYAQDNLPVAIQFFKVAAKLGHERALHSLRYIRSKLPTVRRQGTLCVV